MERETPEHILTMNRRSSLTVTGVSQVVSFEEDGALLRTGLGLEQKVQEGRTWQSLSP